MLLRQVQGHLLPQLQQHLLCQLQQHLLLQLLHPPNVREAEACLLQCSLSVLLQRPLRRYPSCPLLQSPFGRLQTLVGLPAWRQGAFWWEQPSWDLSCTALKRQSWPPSLQILVSPPDFQTLHQQLAVTRSQGHKEGGKRNGAAPRSLHPKRKSQALPQGRQTQMTLNQTLRTQTLEAQAL